jgi:hypothetical protein
VQKKAWTSEKSEAATRGGKAIGAVRRAEQSERKGKRTEKILGKAEKKSPLGFNSVGSK